MAQILDMPKLSDTMKEGVLRKWRKNEGDKIAPGELVAEVETDKATMDFEAFDEGVLLKRLVADGATVPVGAPIAIIGKAGEDITAALTEAEKRKAQGRRRRRRQDGRRRRAPAAKRRGRARPAAQPSLAPARRPRPAAPRRRQRPSLRRQPAAQRPPGRARGAGRQRRAPRSWPRRWPAGWPPTWASTCAGQRDRPRRPHRRARRARPPSEAAAPPAAARRAQAADSRRRPTAEQRRPRGRRQLARTRWSPSAAPRPARHRRPGGRGSVKPLSLMRKTIARRLVESKTTIPHFYLTADVDMDAAWSSASRSRRSTAPSCRSTIWCMKAAALALRRVPEANAVVHRGRRSSGTPGSTSAWRWPSRTAWSRRSSATPTRRPWGRSPPRPASWPSAPATASCKAEEMTGSTFSVSNLGMMGIKDFAAIINPPEGAILAVGAVRKEPVVKDDQIVVGQRMSLTLSCDHRVIDGALGAKLLQAIVAILERPITLAF